MSYESYELSLFPEDVPPHTAERMTKATLEVAQSLMDLREINSIFPGVPMHWEHLGNLVEGVSYTVDMSANEAIISFDDESTKLFEEVFGAEQMLTRTNAQTGTRETIFSLKGDRINNVPLDMFFQVGNSEPVGKVYMAFEKMMTIITRTMLLHPESDLLWNTNYEPNEREGDLPQNVLNSLLKFGIATLPFNMRILREMYKGKPTITFNHALNFVEYNGAQMTETPFVRETYSAGFEGKDENNFVISHGISSKLEDPSSSPIHKYTRMSGNGVKEYSRKVMNMVRNRDNAFGYAASTINDLSGDSTRFVVRFGNEPGTTNVQNSTSVYNLNYDDSEMTLYTPDDTKIEIKDLPVAEKVHLVRTLLLAPRLLKDPIGFTD